MKNNNNKTIMLIVGVLVFSVVVGFSIGKYLFEISNQNMSNVMER